MSDAGILLGSLILPVMIGIEPSMQSLRLNTRLSNKSWVSLIGIWVEDS